MSNKSKEIDKNDLSKNITKILENKYIIPLYQRNFAWQEYEIKQLLQDIYDSFLQKKGNYYIGSLVVIERRDSDYEVIDGQQRLTAITLIVKILDPENQKEPKLFYASRPEVKKFYDDFYEKGDIKTIPPDHRTSHLNSAVDIIKGAELIDPNNNNIIKISDLIKNKNFKSFFFNNIIMVFVELPKDIDVANYFEIMNNRGKQLQKHEILKAKLLDKLKNKNDEHNRTKQKTYGKIWDACSQMDMHIQDLFEKEDIKILFGVNYDTVPTKETKGIEKLIEEKIVSDSKEIQEYEYTIDNILNQDNLIKENKEQSYEDNESEDKSIIDFPNFLMHVLRLKYNDEYKKIKKTDIPLDDKKLLTVYNKLKDEKEDGELIELITPEDFISDLLKYRTIYDRYIVKATKDENVEDKFQWTVKKPKNNKSSLNYEETFKDNDHQKRVIKCLSMLQITFSGKIHKNWLQNVLCWFEKKDKMDAKEYLGKLHKYIKDYCYQNENIKNFLEEYVDNDNNKNVSDFYAEGTKTPHFLFNFIDYLYWVDFKKDPSKYKNCKFDFDFRYRNSVEHHLPQSAKDELDDKSLIDSLGNLCLTNVPSNSRMWRLDPYIKANNYDNKKLPAKQKIMYTLTKDEHKWLDSQIKKHYSDIISLLKKRNEILKLEE